MLIQDIHVGIQYLINQGQVQYHEPRLFDDFIYNSICDILNEDWEKYEKSNRQELSHELEYLLTISSELTPVSGLITFPSNCYKPVDIACVESSVDYESEKVSPNGWATRAQSKARPVTYDFSIYHFYGAKKANVLPASNNYKVTYIRMPVKPVFGYSSLSSDTYKFTFDAGSSIDIDLPDPESRTRIMAKVMKYLGVELNDEQLLNFEPFKKRDNMGVA